MILDHEFPPDIRVENEIESLANSGHEIHIACYTRKGKTSNEQTANAIIHRKYISKFICKSSVGALKFPFYFNFWRTFLKGIFQKYRFDAIHVHDLPLVQVGYEFAKKYNISITLDLHENWPALLNVATHTKSYLGRFLSNNGQWERYELKYCNNVDHIIVVVDEAKKRLQKLGIKSDKIKVVSNTLNLNSFEIPNSKPDDQYLTLLYAGGINKHRGLQYVIKGLKYLDNTNKPIRLLILGTGSYTSNLISLAKEIGVIEQVEFLGWKDYREMQYYFGKADICLIPHIKNDHTDSTIPHKIFQYMYAGKPFVASNCIPIERIAVETRAGITYKWDSPEEFASCIKQLEQDKNLMLNLINNGKQFIINKYNWSIDSQKLNGIYK